MDLLEISNFKIKIYFNINKTFKYILIKYYHIYFYIFIFYSATIIVYHPSSSEYGNKFANIGLMGFLGSLSGVNDKKMAISEIGVSYPEVEPPAEAPSFGKTKI